MKLQPAHRLALLGGHPRSGTTLLEQVLDSHPDMVSAEETEIFLDETYHRLASGLPPNSLMLPVLEAAKPTRCFPYAPPIFVRWNYPWASPLAGGC